MQLTARVRGDFVKQLKERSAKWSKVPTRISARIVVPPELNWWYIQEFGGKKDDYLITPKNAKKIAYPSHAGQVVADSVTHPIVKGLHIVGTEEPAIREELQKAVLDFFKNGGGDRPEELRMIVLNVCANAKERITKNMEVQLPGDRPPVTNPAYADTQSGKLKGAKAADVYRALAKVIDTSR